MSAKQVTTTTTTTTTRRKKKDKKSGKTVKDAYAAKVKKSVFALSMTCVLGGGRKTSIERI